MLNPCPKCGSKVTVEVNRDIPLNCGLDSDTKIHWVRCSRCGYSLVDSAKDEWSDDIWNAHTKAVKDQQKKRMKNVMSEYEGLEKLNRQMSWAAFFMVVACLVMLGLCIYSWYTGELFSGLLK